jgi:hypothetical protein
METTAAARVTVPFVYSSVNMLEKPDRKAIRIASIGKEVLPCFALWGKWRKTAG